MHVHAVELRVTDIAENGHNKLPHAALYKLQSAMFTMASTSVLAGACIYRILVRVSQLWLAGAPGQVVYVPGPPGPPGAPGNATATATASAVAIVDGTTVVNGLRTSGVGVLTNAEANRTALLPQQVPSPSPPPPPAAIASPPPPPPLQCLVE